MLKTIQSLVAAIAFVAFSLVTTPSRADPAIYDYYTSAPVAPEDLYPFGGEYYVDGLANVGEAVGILQANLGILADATKALKDIGPIELFFYSGNYDSPGAAPGSAVWYLEVFATFNALTGFVDVEWNGFDAIAFERPDTDTITVRFNTLEANVGQTTIPKVVEVPGPVAGAGLPALIGWATFLVWRRRKPAV